MYVHVYVYFLILCSLLFLCGFITYTTFGISKKFLKLSVVFGNEFLIPFVISYATSGRDGELIVYTIVV